MIYFKWIAAVTLIGSATACVESAPYGGSSGYGLNTVGYQQPAYYNQQSTYYNQQPTYYARPPVNNYYATPQPQVVTQTRYVPVPVAGPPRVQDRNNDGVPDWQQRDRNRNGVPDVRERN